MKNAKRFASLILALVMVFSLAATAFADEITSGSITIKNSNTVDVSGKTFNAYKILDLKVSGSGDDMSYAYSVPSVMKDFYKNYFNITDETDFDAKVVEAIGDMTSNSDELFTFAKAALAAAKAAGITGIEGQAGTAVYKFENLPLGYYVIEDDATTNPVSALVLDTATPDVEVVVKADAPTIDKKIDEDGSLTTKNDQVVENEVAIGDTVTYVITSRVPDMTGYTKYFFIMQDTMSEGLTYNDDLTVKVGAKTLEKGTDYTVAKTTTDDGETHLKIVFNNFIQYKAQMGSEIQVSYTAELNEHAVLADMANTNEVYLQYSNNPNVNYNGTNEPDETDTTPLGETTKKDVETFTTALQINKVDANGKSLTGAEFKLEGTALNIVRINKEEFVENADGNYWKLKDGTYTTDDPATDGMDVTLYESTTVKYIKKAYTLIETTEEQKSVTAVVDENGILRFEGLSAGEYTITETKAPAGYNILTESKVVRIGWDSKNGFNYTFDGQNGESNVISIVNQSGTELPSTGGMGTTLFYLFGGIMVLAAVVLLVTRRRMSIAE